MIKIENNLQINEIECNNDLETLRTEIRKLDLTMSGIHILDVPPGTGKSYRVKEILKGQNSFILATATHKLLGEEYKGLNARHWRGLNEENCKQYQKIKNLKEERIPISLLCGLQCCNKNKCTYWKQFNTKKAICPHELLMDDKIRYKTGNNKGKLKFDILALDESLDKYHFIECNKEHVISSLNVIKQYSSEDICDSFIESLDEMDHYLFEKFFDELYEARRNALRAAIYENSKDNLKKITQFDIYTLRKFYYYTSIHPSIKTYSEPALYRIFDLAREGIPIILLDATFDEKKFRILLERYINEDLSLSRSFIIDKGLNLDLIPIEEVKIQIHRAKLYDKNIKIKKMNKDNFYYKKSFFGKSKNNLTEQGEKQISYLRLFVKSLKKKYTKVGIITYKSLVPYFQDMGSTEYFFNLKGSNSNKDVDALVLIGNPQANEDDVLDQYNKLCLTNYLKSDVYRQTCNKSNNQVLFNDDIHKVSQVLDQNGNLLNKKPRPLMLKNKCFYNENSGEFEINDDYDISEFDMMLSEGEKYQAIHRARLFRADDSNIPEVFIFGDVAERIKEEFEVEYFNNKETSRFISKLEKEMYPFYLFNTINRLYFESGDVIEVAKKLKLYKSSDKSNGWNTKFINAIVKNKVLVGDVRYLHGILTKIRDIEEITDNFPDLKLPDWFIKDCIYYLDKGDFINWKNILVP